MPDQGCVILLSWVGKPFPFLGKKLHAANFIKWSEERVKELRWGTFCHVQRK